MLQNRVMRRAAGLLLSIVSTAMIGLAAGAVWMVLCVYFRSPLIWPIVPLGIAIGWSVAAGVSSSRWSATLLAALATVLAVLYMHILLAAMQISGVLGLDFFYALQQAGPGMLWDLASLSFSATLLLTLATGIALSVLTCLLYKHRAHR